MKKKKKKKRVYLLPDTFVLYKWRNKKKKKERTHCLETTINERTLTHLKKKQTKKTRSLCMLRRQGIGFDLK